MRFLQSHRLITAAFLLFGLFLQHFSKTVTATTPPYEAIIAIDSSDVTGEFTPTSDSSDVTGKDAVTSDSSNVSGESTITSDSSGSTGKSMPTSNSSNVMEESTPTSNSSDVTGESTPTSISSTSIITDSPGTGEPSSTGYSSLSIADTSATVSPPTDDSFSLTTILSSTTSDPSSPASGSTPYTSDPSPATPDASSPTSGSTSYTSDPSASTPDASSPTSGSTSYTSDPSPSTPDASSPTSGSTSYSSDPSFSTPDASSPTSGSTSYTSDPSPSTPDASSPTSGSTSYSSDPSSSTPDASSPTSGSTSYTSDPSTSTHDASSPTSGSTPYTSDPSTSTHDASSPSSESPVSTTTSQSLTENQILDEIKKELINIQSILEDLKNFINSLIILFPTTLTSKSTSTPVLAAAQNREKNFLRLPRAVGDNFCTPMASGNANDLCYQLTYLMDGIQNFTTKFMSDDDITPKDLEEIQVQAQQLSNVVTEVKKDSDFVVKYKVNVQVFNERVDDVTQRINSAIEEADNKIAENNDNSLTDSEILVIVLGTICGAMVMALVVLGVYVINKNAKQRKMKRQRKLNSSTNPLHDFAEGGYDNHALEDEESYSRGSHIEPIVGRDPRSFAEDRIMPRSHAAEAEGSRNPRQERPPVIIARVGSPTRWSTAEGSKPTSPAGSLKKPSGTPRREGRRNEYPKNHHNDSIQSTSYTRPAYNADYDDPYSLERRGANVKRVTTGGMRRVDPY